MRQFPQIPWLRSLSSIVIFDFFSDFSVDSFPNMITPEEIQDLLPKNQNVPQISHRHLPEPGSYPLATDNMNWDYII